MYGDLYSWLCAPGQATVIAFEALQKQEIA
jgi:hypothetical protein